LDKWKEQIKKEREEEMCKERTKEGQREWRKGKNRKRQERKIDERSSINLLMDCGCVPVN
jgi:hypothetical protein